MANIHLVEAVLNQTVVIHPNKGRERKPLARLGRIKGAGKEVYPSSPWSNANASPRQRAGRLPWASRKLMAGRKWSVRGSLDG